MKLWSDFYDLVLPDLPGCPFAVVEQALRQSAIAFCEQSLAWRATLPDIAVVSGTAIYPFVPPAGAVVHTIVNARFNGNNIFTYTGEMTFRDGDWRTREGIPEYILGGATSLTIVPIPNVAGTLALIVALKPSPDALGIDDNIFNEDREAIIHGATMRLMLSPKKPYTNAQLAVYHQQQFSIKTAAAGMRVARSYTRAPLQTTIMNRGR